MLLVLTSIRTNFIVFWFVHYEKSKNHSFLSLCFLQITLALFICLFFNACLACLNELLAVNEGELKNM